MSSRTRKPCLAVAAAVVVAGIGAACSPTPIVVRPADDLYNEGREYQENGYHDAAIDDYKQLLDHYPLDPRAEEVELLIAQAHYANEAFPEAIASFSDFQRMHPTSPRLPEVEYTIGQSYMDQMDTIDRDLSAAANATSRFESVTQRYPSSEYADKARKQLRATREHLAARELYIATFYLGRGKLPAARGRFIELLARYPETTAARDGTERVAAQARAEGDDELAALAEAALQERGPAGSEEGPEAAPSPAGAATAALVRALRGRQPSPAALAASAAPRP